MSDNALPLETVAHLQSAGCKAQKKSVIGAHNRCWGYLRDATLCMARQKEISSSLGGNEIVSCNSCGRDKDWRHPSVGGRRKRSRKTS